MFQFLHGYWPGVWEAQVAAGFVGENDGIRFCQSRLLTEDQKFNELAAVGTELHKILSERKCVFYIDRLQGGCQIEEYPFDQELLKEYKDMLGENFWGFQIHEWMSNYHTDSLVKVAALTEETWTEENIVAEVSKQYPGKYLYLESITLEELLASGKPKTVKQFYDTITGIYKKRMQVGELLPCDSGFLAYGFEISAGAKRFMPEVGAQSANARMQICYARGMSRAEGRSFGVYYEPWGGSPFSTSCYHREMKNEWGIGQSDDFPFEPQGPNGGSSMSLAKRIFLYGFLSGAEFMAEEWGLCNTFYDWTDYEISPYGQTKMEFLNFTRKYTDIGDKLAPIAVVLPKDLMVLDNIYDDNLYCGMEVHSKELAKVKQGIRDVFTTSLPMVGTELKTLKNSDIPDAIDLLNADESVLGRYEYMVDLTCDENFAKTHKNICQIEDLKDLLRKSLPCYVEGNAHWMVNKCESGGYYLTVFNHSGIERTVAKGEVELPEGITTVKLSFKDCTTPTLCEGNGELTAGNGTYQLTIPAGGWAFIKFGN